MFLPKPVYEALPCAYVAAGGICLYIGFGLTLIPSIMETESILLFGAGCILGSMGIAVLSLRFRYRRNRTVFVKQPTPKTMESPFPNDPQTL